MNSSSQIDVSIIVPVHNEEKIIANCLDSLCTLDYPKGNYEIIVVNDGSTDKTSDIVEGYIQKHSNITLLSKGSGGKGSAVNFGLPHTKGEYVIVADADNFLQSNYISEVVRCFREDENVAVIVANHYLVKEDTLLEKVINSRRIADSDYSIYKRPQIGGSTAFRRETLTSVGGFGEEIASTTSVAVDKILGKGYLLKTLTNTCVRSIGQPSFASYLKQRLRWRESIVKTGIKFNKKSLFETSYTHGLSLIMFVSIILLIYSIAIGQFNYIYLVLILLVFFIDLFRYSRALIHMMWHRQQTAFFLSLSIGFEELLRFVSIPYLTFRLIRPRQKPTFSAER